MSQAPWQAAAGGEFSVEIADAFDAVEPSWARLVERSGVEHPFVTPTWMRAWLESFDGEAVRFLVVREAGEPVALVPLLLRTRSFYGLRLRVLELACNDHTPRADVLIAGDAQRVLPVVWRELQRMDDWDVLRLMQLTEDSPAATALPALARREGYPTGEWLACHSPYVPTLGPWDTYERSLKSKHRANLRRRENGLSRLGALGVETVTEPGPALERALADGLCIEAEAWKAREGTAILSDARVRAFYERLAHAAAARGWLRLDFLTLDGRRIAFAYSLEYRRRVYVLKSGYARELARVSPASVLFRDLLRSAFASDIVEYDFLGEHARWKLDWRPELRRHLWIYVFRPQLAPRLAHLVKFRALPWLKHYRAFRAVRRALLRHLPPGSLP